MSSPTPQILNFQQILDGISADTGGPVAANSGLPLFNVPTQLGVLVSETGTLPASAADVIVWGKRKTDGVWEVTQDGSLVDLPGQPNVAWWKVFGDAWKYSRVFIQIINYAGPGIIDAWIFPSLPHIVEGEMLTALLAILTHLTSITATDDDPVIEEGPQIMFQAADFDGAALPAVDDGDAARPAVTLNRVPYSFPVNADGSLSPLQEEGDPSTGLSMQIGGEAFEIDGTSPTAVDEGDTTQLLASLNRILLTTLSDPEGLVAPIIAALNALRVSVTNRESDRNEIDDLADETNLAIGTAYYPSSDGLSNDWFNGYTFTGKMIDADARITLKLQGTNDEDLTAADWIDLYFYRRDTNATVNQVQNPAGPGFGTVTFACEIVDCNYKYLRWEVTTASADNTVIIKGRRKAL